MKPSVKADLKERLDDLRPPLRADGADRADTERSTLIDVIETIIDSLPEDKQPKLKPRGRSGR